MPSFAYLDKEYQSTHYNLFKESITAPLQQVLPPGIEQSVFEDAIRQFKTTVGDDQVLQGDDLAEYIDPYELHEAEGARKMPCAAVRPRNIDELKEVLKVSNDFAFPVWTFSRGKNLGYGGPAPRVNGSIALDLHRMSKVIEVNSEYAYAVVEPGVTFTDLYDYCVKTKAKVWPSVPSLGWGSVVGNTLDRGVGFTPTATHHQHICGVEAMLANGDLVRTGQFGISNSPSSHLSKFTFGPSIEGLFLQSNIGIVTKLGIWLTPAPQAYMSCAFDMPDLEDIETIVDIFGPLRRDGLLPNTVYVSNVTEWLGIMGQREDFWPHNSPIPDWKVAELQKTFDMGYWNARFGLYGAKDVIQAHFDELKKIISRKTSKGRLIGKIFSAPEGETLDPTTVPDKEGGFFVGIPTLWSLPMVKFRLPKKGGGIAAHYDYSPIIPSNGKEILEWVKTAKKICEAQSFDLFCDFFMHERHVIFVNMFTFDKTNAEHRRAVQAIFDNLFEEGRKRGYSKYRSHVRAMDRVASLYNFNDHAYRRFVESIKDAVDPNGILSPGKQGIWPKRFRQNESLRANL
ncbi:FAD-linked oxidase-like protein [Setomelanomma holmii]|uniref:FAD-linked oxidase-like protein n=1 Tax=Setomelanomma holmii TaxID=210430 RepID=A0A9P4HBU6_9PLEO|nr:FAD-linked oxidase-like protein [Setomelanomma holmii]